jgi:hypothetical protein
MWSDRYSAGRFICCMALAAVVGYFCPFGNKTDLTVGLRAIRTDASIAVVGNSVVDHSSKCDRVSASIPELLSVYSGMRVVDLSSSGQLLEESSAYAGIVLRNSGVTTIVVLLSYASLADNWAPSLQRASFLDVLSVGKPFPLDAVVRGAGGIRGRVLRAHEAFEYNGTKYPDYEGIKARYLETERAAMPCPENNGINRSFIEAYYYHLYHQAAPDDHNLAALVNLSTEARDHGKRVLIAIMPIDYELIDSLDLNKSLQLRQRVWQVVKTLRESGLEVIDSSATLPNDRFADRWCACGHLLLAGRSSVAQMLAPLLGSAAPPHSDALPRSVGN